MADLVVKRVGSSVELRSEHNGVESRVETTTWTAPTLSGAWVNYGGGFQTARYRKVGDRVEIEGLVRTGAAGLVFTLPVGFRPPASLVLATMTNTGAGELSVTSGGAVNANTGGNGYVSLHCSFSVTA